MGVQQGLWGGVGFHRGCIRPSKAFIHASEANTEHEVIYRFCKVASVHKRVRVSGFKAYLFCRVFRWGVTVFLTDLGVQGQGLRGMWLRI